MTNKFFVYGTLMTNCSNNYVILKSSILKVETAFIEDMDLYNIPCANFPAMVPGSRKVHGEVVTIKESYLKAVTDDVDALEGYYNPGDEDNFYNREIKNVSLSSGEEVEAYVYLFNKYSNLGSIIEDGNFKSYIQQKSKEAI